MTLEEARRKLPFLLYDELDFEEENHLAKLLSEHAELRAELDHLRAIFRAVDQGAVDPTPGLLSQCRTRLHSTLNEPSHQQSRGIWVRFANWIAWPRMSLKSQLAGALAMMLLGVAAGRWTMQERILPRDLADEFVSQPTEFLANGGWTPRVREIRTNSDGSVQIELEEVKRRLVQGMPQDGNVRALLLSAARYTSDPSLRVGTLDLLSSQGSQPGVRDVLIYALRNDSNPGVRLKALEGLQNFSGDSEVRESVRTALLSDLSPAVRMQAVDLLMRDRSRPEAIGLLQELMKQEENRAVRERCESALTDLNATTETF